MDNWLNWAAGLMTVVNAFLIAYQGWKKLKPEVKKMDAEADLDSIEVAAKSQQLLVDRVNELEELIKEEREHRKLELQQERENWKAALEAEKETRKRDKEYFQRRLMESDSEARSYRRWAAQLVKQVVEAGKVPAAYIPYTEESQQGIPAIRGEQERRDDK